MGKNVNKDQLRFEFSPCPVETNQDSYHIIEKIDTSEDPYHIKEKLEIQKTTGSVDITQGEYESYYREFGKRILDTSEEPPEPHKKKMRPFDIMNRRMFKDKKTKTTTRIPQNPKPVARKAEKPKDEIDLLDFLRRNLKEFAAPDKIEELKSIADYLQSSPVFYKVKNIDNGLLEGDPVRLEYKTLINYLLEPDRCLLLKFIDSLLIDFRNDNDVKGISDFNNAYED